MDTTNTMAEMVARFNELAEKLELTRRAGPKTFNSKAKALAAIKELEVQMPVLGAQTAAIVEVAEALPEVKVSEVVAAVETVTTLVETATVAETAQLAVALVTAPTVVAEAPKMTEELPEAPKTKGVGERARVLLQQSTDGQGLSYAEILTALKAEFPTNETSIACLRWYASKMKSEGMTLPSRPRAVKA